MEEDFLSNKLWENTNEFLSKKEFDTLKEKLEEDRKEIVNLNKSIRILASSLNILNALIKKNTTKELKKNQKKKLKIQMIDQII